MSFVEVYAFAQRPVDSKTERGVLTHVDPTIYVATVLLLASNEQVCVALHPADCTESLVGIVHDQIARIECDTDRKACVQLFLMIDPDAVEVALDNGTFGAEEHVINLARAVWREARVRTCFDVDVHGNERTCMPRPCLSPPSWRPEMPLFEHQRSTVQWMVDFEARVPLTVEYAGNVQVSRRWYVDTENECFTTNRSTRMAELAGGICADGMGTGKTATLLYLVALSAARSRDEDVAPHRPKTKCGAYNSNATLVIVPVNLVSQWQAELRKFVVDDALNVIFVVQGRDLKSISMEQLCAADMVVTTFHFLRTSKAYVDMVETALGSANECIHADVPSSCFAFAPAPAPAPAICLPPASKVRTRAALSAWSRRPNRAEPVLEAVTWRRVVVDELHETFESPRDMRQLKLFTTQITWGLSATPVLDTDQAHQLYLFLARDKSHHPNLLSQIIRLAVRDHTSTTMHIRFEPAASQPRASEIGRDNAPPTPTPTTTTTQRLDSMCASAPLGPPEAVQSLKLVQLSAEERTQLRLEEADDAADVVQRCTLPPTMSIDSRVVGIAGRPSSTSVVPPPPPLRPPLSFLPSSFSSSSEIAAASASASATVPSMEHVPTPPMVAVLSSHRKSKRTAVLLRLEAFERSVRVLEAAATELQDELDRLRARPHVALERHTRLQSRLRSGGGGGGGGVGADSATQESHSNLDDGGISSKSNDDSSLNDSERASCATKREHAAQLALEAHMRDLAAARQMRDNESAKLARIDEADRVVRDRLRTLCDEVCPACRTNAKCDAFVRCCARTLCTECARSQQSQGVCALCDGCADDAVVSVPCLRGMGTKMTKIGELVTSLKDDPIVLFVQWKSMVRGTRSFLSSLGVRVLLMEGSMAQRASTLAEFATSGVLLLCLEDCFAGLHLPHVRHIVFAHAIVAERKQVERYERQAIARCVRYGQTEQVNVYSFVVSDTEEERLWHRTHTAAEVGSGNVPLSRVAIAPISTPTPPSLAAVDVETRLPAADDALLQTSAHPGPNPDSDSRHHVTNGGGRVRKRVRRTS